TYAGEPVKCSYIAYLLFILVDHEEVDGENHQMQAAAETHHREAKPVSADSAKHCQYVNQDALEGKDVQEAN
ncbi:hypothetical protein PMAYCL1PPCAC_25688, partial [Pristionchus mayeri]